MPGSPDAMTISLKAAADLSAKQYHAVKITAAHTVNVVTAATDKGFILLNKPAAANEAAMLCIGGRSKVKIGGTVSAGDLLGPDTDAMLIAVTADESQIIAIALEAGVDGDIIDAIVFPISQIATA